MSAPLFDRLPCDTEREPVDAFVLDDAIESVAKLMKAAAACYHVEEFPCALELLRVAETKVAELAREVEFTISDEKTLSMAYGPESEKEAAK